MRPTGERENLTQFVICLRLKKQFRNFLFYPLKGAEPQSPLQNTYIDWNTGYKINPEEHWEKQL